MKKAVVRWTVGPYSELALRVLRLSIHNIRKLYRDRFFLTVTYNNVPESKIKMLPIDSAINQSCFINDLPVPPPEDPEIGMAWKLYPARTDDSVHEIMLDNDLVLYSKMECIERFLASDSLFLITEAVKRSYSYSYDHQIPSTFNINSGFVALPPHFDYKGELMNAVIGDWDNRFDEQSVVAKVLSGHNVEIIPRTDISITGPSTEYELGNHGVHFIGLNGGFDFYWRRFMEEMLI